MIELDRRTLLTLGLGTLAAGASGCTGPTGGATVPAPQTYAEWTTRRQAPYYVAHRGAGTTIPEHSVPGYRKAIEWGADALELSVVISSDGVLFCHHDLTLDRTTTLTGKTSQTSAARLDTARIQIPRLGPRWTGTGMPGIPRLEAALDDVGRKILCVEAKDDAAYEPMMELLDKRGLLPQVMVKVGYDSSRVDRAKSAGLPVFAYFGTVDTVTHANVLALAAKLGPSDAIVLPARSTSTDLIDDSTVKRVVATGVPVWVYPVHRRSEVEHFSALGVGGFVTPALGYLTGTVPVNTRDSFSTRALAPGLTTRDPYSDWDAVGWNTADAIELIGSGGRSVCLGDLSPVAAPGGAYRVDLDLAMVAGPMAASDAFYLAFGCPNDTYFDERVEGYTLSLRQDGLMQLFDTGQDRGKIELARAATPLLKQSDWTTLSVQVNPRRIAIARDGQILLRFAGSVRGGAYLHIGRTHGAAKLALRAINVKA